MGAQLSAVRDGVVTIGTRAAALREKVQCPRRQADPTCSRSFPSEFSSEDDAQAAADVEQDPVSEYEQTQRTLRFQLNPDDATHDPLFPAREEPPTATASETAAAAAEPLSATDKSSSETVVPVADTIATAPEAATSVTVTETIAAKPATTAPAEQVAAAVAAEPESAKTERNPVLPDEASSGRLFKLDDRVMIFGLAKRPEFNGNHARVVVLPVAVDAAAGEGVSSGPAPPRYGVRILSGANRNKTLSLLRANLELLPAEAAQPQQTTQRSKGPKKNFLSALSGYGEENAEKSLAAAARNKGSLAPDFPTSSSSTEGKMRSFFEYGCTAFQRCEFRAAVTFLEEAVRIYHDGSQEEGTTDGTANPGTTSGSSSQVPTAGPGQSRVELRKLLARTYRCLGTAQDKLHLSEQTVLGNLKEAQKIAFEISDFETAFDCLTSMGSSKMRLGELLEAETLYKQSLEFSRRGLHGLCWKHEAQALGNVGIAVRGSGAGERDGENEGPGGHRAVLGHEQRTSIADSVNALLGVEQPAASAAAMLVATPDVAGPAPATGGGVQSAKKYFEEALQLWEQNKGVETLLSSPCRPSPKAENEPSTFASSYATLMTNYASSLLHELPDEHGQRKLSEKEKRLERRAKKLYETALLWAVQIGDKRLEQAVRVNLANQWQDAEVLNMVGGHGRGSTSAAAPSLQDCCICMEPCETSTPSSETLGPVEQERVGATATGARGGAASGGSGRRSTSSSASQEGSSGSGDGGDAELLEAAETSEESGGKKRFVVLECGHNFHKDCLTKFWETSASAAHSCPLCRSVLGFTG
eukprot:g458.t1